MRNTNCKEKHVTLQTSYDWLDNNLFSSSGREASVTLALLILQNLKTLFVLINIVFDFLNQHFKLDVHLKNYTQQYLGVL